VVDNTALNSSDNLHSYPPDNHHCSGDVYWEVLFVSVGLQCFCLSDHCLTDRCIILTAMSWSQPVALHWGAIFETSVELMYVCCIGRHLHWKPLVTVELKRFETEIINCFSAVYVHPFCSLDHPELLVRYLSKSQSSLGKHSISGDEEQPVTSTESKTHWDNNSQNTELIVCPFWY